MTNFNFSDIIEWDALSEAERTDILRRPAVMAGDKITAVVSAFSTKSSPAATQRCVTSAQNSTARK